MSDSKKFHADRNSYKFFLLRLANIPGRNINIINVIITGK